MKFKNKKFIINTLALVMAIMICFANLGFNVFAITLGTLNVWNSSSIKIAEWQNVPTYVHCVNLCDNGSNDIDLLSHVQFAVNQWNTYLNTNIIAKDSTTGNVLTAYAGPIDTIGKLGIWPEYTYTFDAPYGESLCDDTYIGTWYLSNGNYARDGYSITYARFVIYDKDEPSSYLCDSIITHELGHSLGWRGHSTNSSDVMYAYYNGVRTLTYRDRSHLSQIYTQ